MAAGCWSFGHGTGNVLHGNHGDLATALLAVTVFGLAESLGQGSLQIYAVDQAPAEKRGAFLGMWLLFTNAGQITGPLVIGTIADAHGFKTGFVTVVAALVVAAGLMAMLGRDTRAGARAQDARRRS